MFWDLEQTVSHSVYYGTIEGEADTADDTTASHGGYSRRRLITRAHPETMGVG